MLMKKFTALMTEGIRINGANNMIIIAMMYVTRTARPFGNRSLFLKKSTRGFTRNAINAAMIREGRTERLKYITVNEKIISPIPTIYLVDVFHSDVIDNVLLIN